MAKDRPRLILTTHIESRSRNLPELKAIHQIHYNEISEHKKQGFPLNPNDTEYYILEERGQLLHVTLRHQGEIVGYFDGILRPSLHYKDCFTLQMDILYICMKARGQNAGPLLLDAVKKEAIKRGVRCWTMHYKVARSKHMRKILKDFGFIPYEISDVMWL